MKKKGYEVYRELLSEMEMPLGFVDIDALERNAEKIARRAEEHDKTVRVVSKSVRSAEVLRRILSAEDCFEGVMSYSAKEARFLSEERDDDENPVFDDILVAYPVWHENEILAACDANGEDAEVTLVVSSEEHVKRIDEVVSQREEEVTVPVCIDIDMSKDYPGLRFGVYRSNIRTRPEVLELASDVDEADGVSLTGVMGYEAQIAGLGDRNPGNSKAKNAVIRQLKKRSKDVVLDRRRKAVEALEESGYKLEFVNGGGTGSLSFTASDPSTTEVAVGSGFYFPHLFDYHDRLDYEPAAGFAVEVTRKPTDDIYTCRGGGYVASGPVGVDKAPKPVLPEGAELTQEGAGEVQTPVRYDGDVRLERGNPVVFRYSKAGEMCERFDSMFLLRTDVKEVVNEVPTYRGEGHCFM